ncbi:hypothetical protein NRBB11_1425 [Bifidobacterium breve]|nr:hypothetical protein NRBB11_1425 [Bifidobacterium breve]
MGSDCVSPQPPLVSMISIHAPRMGSDETQKPLSALCRISIHAPRMGSDGIGYDTFGMRHISIHAPRMGSDGIGYDTFGMRHISIHAPRMGSDGSNNGWPQRRPISIHAPRMGSDRCCYPAGGRYPHFNPRSPDGERPKFGQFLREYDEFQSTLPGWGATEHQGSALPRHPISIHAPRMGSDYKPRENGGTPTYFNPRSPDGERQKSIDSRSSAS